MIAFTLPGGLPIYSFPLLLGIGTAVGLTWVAWRVKAKQVSGHLDAALAALLGGLLGGRLVYVVLNWLYFRSHPGEILQIQLGGLTWIGAILGGLLALSVFAALMRRPVLGLLDALLPLVTVLVMTSWLACWLDGCAYGRSSAGWWAFPARDEWGVITPRLPVQFLGATLTLVLFWLVDAIDLPRSRQPVPGTTAVRWWAGFSLLMLALSFLRGDPAPVLAGLRLDTWASLTMAVLPGFVIIVAYLKRKGERDTD